MFADRSTLFVRPHRFFMLVGLWLLASSPVQAQGSTSARWQPCAAQDEICRFSGQATVRYGADGKYAYKSALNRIICDHQEFGDPAFGVPKTCEYSTDANAMPLAPHQGAWTACATEGQTCAFPGSARVRYGVDGQYVYRNATGSISCSVNVFGDPAFGRHKTCDYQPHAGVISSPVQDGWEYCASEGGVCNFSGPAEVRYGAQGKFVTIRAVNGVPCGVAAFGRDPNYGQLKQCFVRHRR